MDERVDGYRTAIGVMHLLRLLEEAPDRLRPVNWLAERLEVDRRTIRRWAHSLEGQLDEPDGRPKLVLTRGTPGREATVQLSRKQDRVTSAHQRAAAFALAATRYLASTGAQLLEDLADSLITAQAGHDAETVSRLKTAVHYIPFGGKLYQEKSDEVDDVFCAVIYRQPLEFDYTLVEQQRSIRVRVEPYSLVIYRDALYMLGRRMGVGAPVMRVYAIDRMSNPSRDRSMNFDVPTDYNPADCIGDLGLWRPDRPRERLEVVFAQSAARYVRERAWPGFVAWRAEPDGRERLVLEIRLSREVEQWLLGYGADAEVLEPEWLREKVRDEVARMVGLYERVTVRP